MLDFFFRLRQLDKFDGVWIDRAFLAEFAWRAGFREFVVDVDDLLSVRLRRELAVTPRTHHQWYYRAELRKLENYEKSLTDRYWRLAVCKEEDRDFFPRDRHKVLVVPNGVSEYPRYPLEREVPGSLLFVGSLDFEPNADAVHWLVKEIIPVVLKRHSTTRLAIVGHNPPASLQALDNGITTRVHGSAPDVSPFYESASVVVAPLRMGSGTKLKVLEALGRGKALVATSVAAEGLQLRPGIDYLHANSGPEFADATVRLIENSALRRRLATSGRQRVLELFNWSRIGQLAERALFGVEETGAEFAPAEHPPWERVGARA